MTDNEREKLREILTLVEEVYAGIDGTQISAGVKLVAAKDQLRALLEAEEESGVADWRWTDCGICGAAAGRSCYEACPTEGCDCPTHNPSDSAPEPEPEEGEPEDALALQVNRRLNSAEKRLNVLEDRADDLEHAGRTRDTSIRLLIEKVYPDAEPDSESEPQTEPPEPGTSRPVGPTLTADGEEFVEPGGEGGGEDEVEYWLGVMAEAIPMKSAYDSQVAVDGEWWDKMQETAAEALARLRSRPSEEAKRALEEISAMQGQFCEAAEDMSRIAAEALESLRTMEEKP